MTARRRTLLGLAVLVIAGLLRLPAEHAMTDHFRERRLLPEPLDLELKEEIGQNSSAIALAGLQTLVATFTSLQATEHYSRYAWTDPRMEKAWRKVEDSMNTTVRLAPRGVYYWDMGAYHTAYNASSWARNESGLPPVRARSEALRWVEKGRAFHRRGIARNPDDWELPYRLGLLLSSPFHFPDDAAAADAFRQALAVEGAPDMLRRRLLFSEARSGKDDPAATLAEVRRLLQERSNRVPTMLCLAYTLEYRIAEPDDPLELAVRVFGSEENALRCLSDYYINTLQQRWPETGVEAAVRRLERRKGIYPEDPASSIRQKRELREQRERLGL